MIGILMVTLVIIFMFAMGIAFIKLSIIAAIIAVLAMLLYYIIDEIRLRWFYKNDEGD